MRTIAVVPAAGSGKRLGLKTKKPFVLLAGKPLITYALKELNSSKSIEEIVVAVEKGCVGRLESLIDKFKFKKKITVVVGGKTRYESVRNCLNVVDSNFDMVLIHDGARPFLYGSSIEGVIRLAKRFGAAIVAVPESDTVKKVDEGLFVNRTLDRKELWRAQTPQGFRYNLIKKAYDVKSLKDATDDATLVERLGKPIKIFRGSYRNIKITTKEDLKLAEVLICESA